MRSSATRIFTGKACKRGHIAERLLSSRQCVECAKELARCRYQSDPSQKKAASKRWKQENPERVREWERTKRKPNPEAAAKRAAKYRAANREKVLGATKRWREANPEKARTARKNWAKENIEAVRLWTRQRRARRIGAAGSHTAEELAEIFRRQRGRCAYCRSKISTSDAQVDHIVALAAGGSNYARNLQYLCAPCNGAKRADDPVTFARKIGRLI